MRVFVIFLCLGLATSAGAETGPDCAGLTEPLRGLPGYVLTVPPAGPAEGWCVLDGAIWRSTRPGWPNLSVEGLRLRHGSTEGQARIEARATGLRVLPMVGDRTLDDRLRALFRLQTADLRLEAARTEADDRLDLRTFELRLSGGTELVLSAEIRGAGLAPASLAAGAVTRLDLRWRSDGRLAGPVLDLAGEALAGMGGKPAVDAARQVLSALVTALPEAALTDGSRTALAALVADLPQGRGTLQLTLSSKDGIGAARIAMAALSDDPLGPKALALLFKDARIAAIWVPGIAP